jgi:hypothetical protein
MDLKALKAQLDAAAAKLAEKPGDAALVAAHAEAKTAYDAALAAAQDEDDAEEDGNKDDKDSGKLDVSKLDPKVQKLIKDLRKENAGSRKEKQATADQLSKLKKSLVEAGIIEGEDEAPEEKIQKLTAETQVATFENAVLQSAVEHGVGKADLKYFKFLVQERVSELKDGEELDDDAMAELAKSAKRSAPGNGGSTSVGGKGGEGGSAPAPGGSGDVTLDVFVKMNMGEKSALFLKQPDLYNKLIAEAKSKKVLV